MTSPEETLYRRVNLLNSLMVAGWLVLLLALAIGAIALYGRQQRLNRSVTQLDQRVADLNDKLSILIAPPPQPQPPGDSTAVGTPNAGANAGTEPGRGTGRLAATPALPVAQTQPATTPEQPEQPEAGNYDVSPTAGLPTADPDRPAGLAGWLYDLRTNSQREDDNPFLLFVTGPLTVRDALKALAKIAPADAAKGGATPDDLLRAAQLFCQNEDYALAHDWAAASPADAERVGQGWLIRGLASMGLRNYPQAIEELGKAVERLPKAPQALKALGEAYASAKRLDEAAAVYRRAADAAPGDLAIASRLAELLTLTRQTAPAIELLRKVVAEDPARSADRAHLARLLIAEGKAADALAVLDGKPDGAPDDIRLLLARGHAYRAMKELPKAEAAFEQAVRMTPLSAEGWHFLGEVRLLERKTDQAVVALNMAIARDSTNPTSWEYLGVALANQGKLDEAIAKLNEAIRLNVGSAQTHYILAMLYAQRKQPDLAVEQLKKAVALEPARLAEARKNDVFTSYPADSAIGRYLKSAAP